jgi:putative transposase
MDGERQARGMLAMAAAERSSKEHKAKSRLRFQGTGRRAVPPQLVQKHQTRLEGFEDKILTLYARGMTTRDIQAQVQDLYGVEVSPTFISNITEAVMDEVRQWQNRPLDQVYPIVYVDCLVVKVRENQRVINKAIYLALGVDMDGQKELLGMWIAQNEGAKFWLAVFTELQNRGVKDIFIACMDGLTGLPEAIETLYPQTRIQLCMVHMVRNSLKYVSYKHRKEVAADLKLIYSAGTESEAGVYLELFTEKWDRQYPTIGKMWHAHWSRVIPLFAFPEDIRKVIYTTNAIESVNMSLRKVTRNHRIFPSDEAVFKVIYLAIQNIAKKWTMPIHNWKPALNCFAIEFAGRVPQE